MQLSLPNPVIFVDLTEINVDVTLARWVRQYQAPLLEKALYRYYLQQADAEDAVQKTFTKACRHLQKKRLKAAGLARADAIAVASGEEPPPATFYWLSAILQNEIFSNYRKTKNKKTKSDGLDHIPDVNQAAVDAWLNRADEFERINRLFSRLPLRQATILVLRFFSGDKRPTYKAIAAWFNAIQDRQISVATVRRECERALATLRSECQERP